MCHLHLVNASCGWESQKQWNKATSQAVTCSTFPHRENCQLRCQLHLDFNPSYSYISQLIWLCKGQSEKLGRLFGFHSNLVIFQVSSSVVWKSSNHHSGTVLLSCVRFKTIIMYYVPVEILRPVTVVQLIRVRPFCPPSHNPWALRLSNNQYSRRRPVSNKPEDNQYPVYAQRQSIYIQLKPLLRHQMLQSAGTRVHEDGILIQIMNTDKDFQKGKQFLPATQ